MSAKSFVSRGGGSGAGDEHYDEEDDDGHHRGQHASVRQERVAMSTEGHCPGWCRGAATQRRRTRP